MISQLQSRAQFETLRTMSIFKSLPESVVRELQRRAVARRWCASAIIIAQGEAADGLHIVYRGQVKSVLFGESGREMTLALAKAGDFFGEDGVIDGKPHGANVVALEDSVVLTIDRATFLNLLRSHPDVALRLLAELAERSRHAKETIGNLALHDVISRLTRTLITLAQQQGERRVDGVMIRYRPTQQDLANMVGTCRETVSRALSSMARRGLVVSRGRSLLLRRELIDRYPVAA